jgi:hypothetical protein
MANYTPFQVYERVPFREKAPDRVIFTGKFSPAIGSDADIPIQLRILEPVAAAGTWSGFTGAGYPGFEEAGSVKFSLPRGAKVSAARPSSTRSAAPCSSARTRIGKLSTRWSARAATIGRWFAEMNLFSRFISNALRVSEVQLSASIVAGWVLQNTEAGT